MGATSIENGSTTTTTTFPRRTITPAATHDTDSGCAVARAGVMISKVLALRLDKLKAPLLAIIEKLMCLVLSFDQHCYE